MKYLALVLAAFLMATNALAAATFADVPRDHWAYDAISRCVETGILKGFDGKFHGKKLLNRYQMAVVVAKILDQTKGGLPSGAAPKPTDIQNLEALTIEFADELALLNVKVSTLEDSFVELKHDVEKLKGTGPAVAAARPRGRGFDLKGYASFALVKTEQPQTVIPSTIRTPYTAANPDALFFTSPLASLAIMKDVGEGVTFNFRLNNEADVGTGNPNTAIDFAYFDYKGLLGDNVDGTFGGFHSAKFSMEHNGAFDTTDYSISPSFLNDSWRRYHMYGMQFTGAQNKKTAGGIELHAAVVSGTDALNGAGNNLGILNNETASVTQTEGNAVFPGETGGLTTANEIDGDPGFWAFLRKARGNGNFGFNLLIMDNGGSANGAAVGGTDEWNVMQVGGEYAKDDIHFIVQYLQGSMNRDATPNQDEDTTNLFALVNYKLDPKQSVTLRMENYEFELNSAPRNEFQAMTFAYNRQVTENSMFQLEYLEVDNETQGSVAVQDVEDTLLRFRYKVWF